MWPGLGVPRFLLLWFPRDWVEVSPGFLFKQQTRFVILVGWERGHGPPPTPLLMGGVGGKDRATA